jgi:hypothetical protein
VRDHGGILSEQVSESAENRLAGLWSERNEVQL